MLDQQAQRRERACARLLGCEQMAEFRAPELDLAGLPYRMHYLARSEELAECSFKACGKNRVIRHGEDVVVLVSVAILKRLKQARSETGFQATQIFVPT